MAKEVKPSQGMLYKNIACFINGEPSQYLNRQMFKWPHKLMLVKERTSAAYTIIQVKEDNVCEPVSNEWVAQELQIALKEFQILGSYFAFDMDKCRSCVQSWIALTSNNRKLVLDQHPQAVAFKDDRDLCYHKLPFPRIKEWDFNDFPTWCEIINRMNNSKAFCIFVYSLLDPYADQSQYCYIYGEGGSGKSSIGAWLQRLIGGAFTTAASSQMFDNHWSETIVGKRLCYVKEANSSFPGSDKMKGLTGDKQILINPKGKSAYMVNHQCKFVFVSNYQLELDSKSENTRRAIYCELPKFEGKPFEDNDYQQKLWDESPKFIAYCMKIYNENCYGGKIIPVDNTRYQELIDETELGVTSFIDRWFIKNEDGHVTMKSFQLICAISGVNKYKKREILEHLRRNWQIRKSKGDTVVGEKVNTYKGISLSKFAESKLLNTDNVLAIGEG